MAAKPQLDCRPLRHRFRRLEVLQPLRLAEVAQGRLVLDGTDR